MIVGSAEVLIKAVDSGIESDIKRKVDRAVSKADKTVKITADTKSAEASISRFGSVTRTSLDDITSRLTSGLGPASGEAKAALDGLTKSGSLIGPAIAGGIAIAAAAVAAFAIDGAQKFVALAGEVRNFQRLSGASAEESSRFVAVLDDLGISSETGSRAIGKLNREIGDGGKNLAKYGVEIAKASDGTSDAIGTLLNLADAYVKTDDPGKRAALVMDTLGRQGQALIPVLEQGRAGVEKFFAGVKDNEIFDDEEQAKARRFELAMDDLSDSFRELQLQAGEALLPFLISLAEGGAKVIGFIDKVKGIGGGVLGEIAKAASGPIGQVVGLLGGLAGKGDNAKKSQKELAEQVARTTAEQEEQAEASKEQAAALDKVTNATLSAVSSQLGYQSSLNTLKDNINDIDDRTQEYQDAVNEAAQAHIDAEKAVRQYGRASEETNKAIDKATEADKKAEQANRALRDAHLGVEQSALQTAGAMVKMADDAATMAGKTLTAQEKAAIFRDSLVELANQASGPTRDAILGLADQILGLPDSKTVTVYADTSEALAAIASLERRLASISAGADSTSGAQQFARGMDVGPVKGPPGAAVPIIAHAGEWVLTPEQLADLRRNSAGLSSSVTTSTLSASTALTITGPLVVVQGGVAPGQEGAIGAAVKRAVTQLVADGTVSRAMSKRSESLSRR